LSKESELWDRENVYVLPHVAAKPTPRTIAALFFANLDQYRADPSSLPFQFHFEKQY
jgi:phosphoglycerate dehydrogenase-like enzyme